MTGLNHALTGATVAAAINKPILALPAALLSHFLVDAIPHWDYKVPGGVKGRQKVMLVDLCLSLCLLFILAMTLNVQPWLVIAGGLLGILPDAMWLVYFMSGKPSIRGNKNSPMNRIKRFHHWIQWSETRWGIIVEAIWFVAMLVVVYKSSY
jgi:hypothetical protein